MGLIRNFFRGLEDWFGGPKESSPAPPSAPEAPAYLGALATSLWRLKAALAAPSSAPAGDPRRVERHVEAMWDLLADGGVRIQDHTGAPFDAGLSLKVLAFQETPGLEKDVVVETIKPTVYCQNRVVQMGEVIVGTPPRAAPKKEEG